MNASIRRVHNYSQDPVQLAREVGELARDLYQRTKYSFDEVRWTGVVTLGKKWRLDVGRTKPVAIVAIDVVDETNRSKLLPGAVRWEWVDGQAQIDDVWTPVAGGVKYTITFLVIHKVGA